MTTGAFSPAELDYLQNDQRRIGRLATADASGRPQVTPVGMWHYNAETGTIDITGRDFESTRKFRNVAVNPQAAFVVDDVLPSDSWQPRAVIVEGSAQALSPNRGSTEAIIRITPERVISWGLDETGSG